MRLNQRTRVIVLILYVLILFGASKMALGHWFPPTTEKGLWFYTGLAALLLGNLLVTPFFTKPADAISYAVSGIVALLAVYPFGVPGAESFEKIMWVSLLTYMVLVIVVSFAAISFREASSPTGSTIGSYLFRLSDRIGDARPVYTSIFAYALVAFSREDATEFGILLVVGLIVVLIQPLESIFAFAGALVAAWRGTIAKSAIGDLLARQEPGVILVKQASGSTSEPGDLVMARSVEDEIQFGVVLDRLRLAGETWVRVIRIAQDGLSVKDRATLAGHPIDRGTASRLTASAPVEIVEKLSANSLVSQRERIVGIVAPDTNLGMLVAEITNTDRGLVEGRLIQTRIGTIDVIYQVIAGISKEEILQQRNTYGFARAQARKIGAWNETSKRFDNVKWLPLVNEPIFILSEEHPEFDPDVIGHFPGTSYGVRIDVNRLVTHNTAILGILGSGKTILAWELVARMRRERIRVICLDITDQYADELGFAAPQRLQELYNKRNWGKDTFKQNKEEGGGVKDFKEKLFQLIGYFLSSACDDTLLIIDPAKFDVWQQTGGIFSGSAAMSSLTPAQVTRLIAEIVLELVQDKGTSTNAKVCLVLEEAHSLAPEWNSAAQEGDSAASNGTAKAILQGRKYGLGSLCITQRTANVTKTILSQCNTLFALRVFDATGLDFLKNFIGEDFADILSTMDERHCVLFGRASSCADPVLLALNDRAEFLKGF